MNLWKIAKDELQRWERAKEQCVHIYVLSVELRDEDVRDLKWRSSATENENQAPQLSAGGVEANAAYCSRPRTCTKAAFASQCLADTRGHRGLESEHEPREKDCESEYNMHTEKGQWSRVLGPGSELVLGAELTTLPGNLVASQTSFHNSA